MKPVYVPIKYDQLDEKFKKTWVQDFYSKPWIDENFRNGRLNKHGFYVNGVYAKSRHDQWYRLKTI